MTGYDAIVVGARCAGAATAMLLARQGLEVLLVDRATFPSDIPHGHFIHRHGPARLARWGLLDRVLASGCPPVTKATQDLGDFQLHGEGIEADGVPFGVAPRRSVLDRILVEAAVEAGAHLRDGFPVLEYTASGGHITGIRGRNGRQERGTVVIGADGRSSALARTVQAPITRYAPTIACWYFTYFAGVEGDGLEMHLRDERVVFAFPTNEDLFAVFVGWPIAELAAVRADLQRCFMAVVHQVDGLGDRVRAGERVERFLGATQLPNFVRRPHGPGWALVGDAGCHKDPMMALGVCDAFRDAELLAEAVTAGLSGDVALDHALADYERRRDEATLPDFEMNLAWAHLKPPPAEVYAARAAARGDRARTRAYFMARQGLTAAVA